MLKHNLHQNKKNKSFFLAIFFLSSFHLFGMKSDTMRCRVLYHPYSTKIYSLHDQLDQTFLNEVFFVMKKNKIVYPGLSINTIYRLDSILTQFDSTYCTEKNLVIAFTEESKKRILEYSKQKYKHYGFADSNYYQGLHFYAFDVVFILDSTKVKNTKLLLDLKSKYQIRFIRSGVKIPAIVEFLEIKPVYLRKHKLKRNGRIYPIK